MLSQYRLIVPIYVYCNMHDHLEYSGPRIKPLQNTTTPSKIYQKRLPLQTLFGPVEP